ncbi:MAG: hypothetical protein QOH23_473 [Gaiellaceae bacterium]|nr:hypothetical protein [Gaiellaceae bacterium]
MSKPLLLAHCQEAHYRSGAVDILQPVDPNERSRRRRRLQRRRHRIRRAVAALVLVGLVAGFAYGARSLTGGKGTASPAAVTAPKKKAKAMPNLPKEVRGVHVTVALASLPGKLDDYIAMSKHGLNTIELDVKDENGEIGFISSSVPLSVAIGAAKPYYKPRQVARKVHAAGLYLIGRVVTFEDPVLSEKRPQLALHNPDGSVWHTNGGLGWTDEYDKRVWDYNIGIAKAAARAGFDEIQFDYVRFPSDGNIDAIVYPAKPKKNEPKAWTIARFAHYAAKQLHPLGVRVSVDVFGLAATRDLGIGQMPSRLAKYVDAVYPMVYPSHFNAGEYGLADPNYDPGMTVTDALTDFDRQLHGTKARLVPWLQDFSLGKTYTYADVMAQIDAARAFKTAGFLLWNPLGLYTNQALAPGAR